MAIRRNGYALDFSDVALEGSAALSVTKSHTFWKPWILSRVPSKKVFW